MASRLKDLHFDQAANLVDDPANPHAKIVLFKRADVKTVDLSDNERRSRVQAAAQDRWGDAKKQVWVYAQDLVGESAIIQRDGKLYSVPFTLDAKGNVTFSGEGDPVATTYEALKRAPVKKEQPAAGSVHVDRPDWLTKELDAAKAEWTAATINELPDASFAVIEPGGTKDDAGKTTPRSLRHLPFKDESGKVDLPHLRNALARLSQTDLSAELKATARAKLESAARSAGVGAPAEKAKEPAVNKKNFFQKLAALFKDAEAGPLQDWASEEEGEPEHTGVDAVDPMKEACDKLGAAIAAYGDGAGLPADHPFHALKALHKELTDKLAAAGVAKEAEAEAAKKAADAKDAEGGRVVKSLEPVTKAIVELQKKLEATEKRATDAEQIAKSERDLRELESEKTTLRKFRHITIDVEKDAPVFAKLRTSDKALYDLMIAKLNGAEAVARKSAAIEQEIGSPLGGTAATAWAEIEAEADKLVAKGEKNLTREKAIDRVMKARPELVARYKAEEAGLVS